MATDANGSLWGRLQRWIQTRFWGMEIHPSARIEVTALIDRTWPQGVHIGADVYMGEQSVLLTHDFTRGLYLHTTVGDRTRVGARAIIMPGVTVGEDCLIMPGALVIKDVPPNSVALGNPATISPRAPQAADSPVTLEHA
jgi:acetyltransferase-like isoleucine patch superfamily enzyme